MKHTVKNWFGDKKLYDYFNSDFKRNKVGKLAFPRSVIKSFTRNDGTIDQAMVDKITDSLGQSIIDAIVKKHFNLTAFRFEYLMEDHQDYLKEAVCYEIQEVIFNKKVMERNGGASISTPSFTIGVDSTNWLFTYDEMSIRTKELVALADLANYKIVGDGFIGKVSHRTPKGELIVYQWNNVELGKELAAADKVGVAYPDFTTMFMKVNAMISTGEIKSVDKYDYAYVKKDDGDALFRFEGGVWTEEANWDRKDIRAIDGNRYLVYKNYMLAGTEKKQEGALLDYTSAKDGEVLQFSSTLGKAEWVSPSFAGAFTKIQFVDVYSRIDFTKFDKWHIVEDMEGQKGFKDGEPALVYVMNGTTVLAFPTIDKIQVEANDFVKLNKIDIIDFGSVVGGPAGVVHHFGDLDDGLQRKNFMDGAFVGQWYTFKIATIPYLVNITGGDRTTRLEWTGIRISKDAGGKDLIESVTGTTTEAAHTENGISIQQQIDNSIALLPSPLTGNYDSQVDNLKVLLDLKDLTPGLTKEYTIPNSLTTATIGGCEVAMNYSNGSETGTTTQGFDLRGWDTSKPLYLSMTYHNGTTYIWVEIKLESVAGDDTKLKITNFKSGAAGSEMNAFGVASMQFKGGK